MKKMPEGEKQIKQLCTKTRSNKLLFTCQLFAYPLLKHRLAFFETAYVPGVPGMH